MALEIISAKLFSPYFGGSIYIWSALLSVSLGGLACGYFIGAKLAEKYFADLKTLFYIIIVGLISLLPIVLFNSIILEFFSDVSLKIAVLECSLLFVFFPILSFGAVSPIIIKIINKQFALAGKSSALVYTTSTTGGVLFTLVFGFFLIPNLGLQFSLLSILICFSFCGLLSYSAMFLEKLNAS